MLTLQNITYIHPNSDLLLQDIHLTVNKYEKVALIGNNGTGKSTLLRIISNELQPVSGLRSVEGQLYYVPQIFGQYNELTISQALNIDRKLKALGEIFDGSGTDESYAALDDDWTIEDRCNEALKYWQLTDLDLSRKLGSLSGGEKTKVFLAGLSIHQPDLILLDEPSNHLDLHSRQLLYRFVQSSKSTMLVVSHDITLLEMLDTVAELGAQGIRIYGGNYDFYKEQKYIETTALNRDIHSKEKALRKAREKERETVERQQKLDSRGKGKQVKAGVPKIVLNTLRNAAENSTSKLKKVHVEKIEGISEELKELRAATADIDTMKFHFDNSSLHRGKILLKAFEANFGFGQSNLWKSNLNFQITSGERLALKGANGSGKTTLLKLISGEIEVKTGTLHRSVRHCVYIDQDYSLIDNSLSIYEQAQEFNKKGLEEHEVKTRLNRFLFSKEDWDKPCGALSGGERMRLMLCCLTISHSSPDLIILDEPTNNLDIQNVEILTAAINDYYGTLIVVSHDEAFLEQVNIERVIEL